MHRLFAVVLALLVLAGSAWSHPSDVSHLRVKPGHQQVEFRLTFNLLTLSRIVAIDSDHDLHITPPEIAKAVPVLAAYLKKKVLVNVNGTDTDLGDFQRYECVWPNNDTQVVSDQEASQRFVDFNFVRVWPAEILEVWTGFQIFAEVGDQHTVQAIYQQEGQPDLPVEFSQFEPEYLYDTGFSAPIAKKEEPRPAGGSPWPLFAVVLALAGGVTGWLTKRRGRGAVLP